jgi:hypothetical protein
MSVNFARITPNPVAYFTSKESVGFPNLAPQVSACLSDWKKTIAQVDRALKNWASSFDVKIYEGKDGKAIIAAFFTDAAGKQALVFEYDKTSRSFKNPVGTPDYITLAKEEGSQNADGPLDSLMYGKPVTDIEKYAGAKAWLELNGNDKERRKIVDEMEQGQKFSYCEIPSYKPTP